MSQTTNILSKVPGLVALLLLGSAARDELSFLEYSNGTVELFSDYEFMTVTSAQLSQAQRQTLGTQLEALERKIANPNPLFHIDVIYRERQRLATMPPIIFTFELKQNARVLYGEDLRSEIPDVTLENLDFRNTNEILYKRLWAILLYLPKRFILGKMSEAERRVAGYVLCRNALDLTTVLLPHEGILLPTYRQRVERLASAYPALSLTDRFGPELPRFLEDCLAQRLSLDFAAIDLSAWYARTIRYLELALSYVSPKDRPIDQTLPTHSRVVFNEWPISQGEWYNLARLTASLLRRQGPLMAYRWLRRPKKGWLTVGLLAMHKALVAWQRGDAAQAEQWLRQSEETLRQIALSNVSTPGRSFLERWLALRKQWGDFWREYIRLGDPKYRQRFENIMEWQHD
ncbi:MAG TPA: hypothetical protein EYP04_04485 [Anaerolineae bacterium]|nr:hypothetical protein [Anaerolineae bacterium]